MDALIENLKKLREQLVRDRGELSFFAAIEREEAPDHWDVLLAAPWAKTGDRRIFDYIATQLKKYLLPRQLLELSSVVILRTDSDFLRSALKQFEVRDGAVLELVRPRLPGVDVARGFILAARGSRRAPSARIPRGPEALRAASSAA